MGEPLTTAAIASAVISAVGLVQGSEQARKGNRRAKKLDAESAKRFNEQKSELELEKQRSRAKEATAAISARRISNRPTSKSKGGTIVTGPSGSLGTSGGGKTLLGV